MFNVPPVKTLVSLAPSRTTCPCIGDILTPFVVISEYDCVASEYVHKRLLPAAFKAVEVAPETGEPKYQKRPLGVAPPAPVNACFTLKVPEPATVFPVPCTKVAPLSKVRVPLLVKVPLPVNLLAEEIVKVLPELIVRFLHDISVEEIIKNGTKTYFNFLMKKVLNQNLI